MRKLNESQKRALYEDIMNDVARVVKSKINESNINEDAALDALIDDRISDSEKFIFELCIEHKYLNGKTTYIINIGSLKDYSNKKNFYQRAAICAIMACDMFKGKLTRAGEKVFLRLSKDSSVHPKTFIEIYKEETDTIKSKLKNITASIFNSVYSKYSGKDTSFVLYNLINEITKYFGEKSMFDTL